MIFSTGEYGERELSLHASIIIEGSMWRKAFLEVHSNSEFQEVCTVRWS